MIRSAGARVAGVIGWPVDHSRSPVLHNHWLARYDIDGAYIPLPVAPENLIAALRALSLLGLRGANVTLPHKQAAARVMDRLDPGAARLEAVNTVLVEPDGTLVGLNTDGFGFLEHMRSTFPAWQPDRGAALILGAGGASRSILAALAGVGVGKLRLSNRSEERARDTARVVDGPVEVIAWPDRHQGLLDAALLVNTTSLGMAGQPSLSIDLQSLPAHAIVADIVYTPLDTPLLQAARARGLAVLDGVGMLLHQARPGFAAWFGIEPRVDEALRQAVLGR